MISVTVPKSQVVDNGDTVTITGIKEDQINGGKIIASGSSGAGASGQTEFNNLDDAKKEADALAAAKHPQNFLVYKHVSDTANPFHVTAVNSPEATGVEILYLTSNALPPAGPENFEESPAALDEQKKAGRR